MSIDEELKRQIEVAAWINENLCIGYSFENDNEGWSHTCFDLVIEHHASVIALCSEHLYGSALALLRVELEAAVRGLWLRHAVTESDLTHFANDKVKHTFRALITLIEGNLNIESGILSYIQTEQWGIFNSFTHTGSEALLRRIGEKTTGYENYTNSDVVKALRFSGLIAVLASVELSSLSKNQELINRTIDFAKAYGE